MQLKDIAPLQFLTPSLVAPVHVDFYRRSEWATTVTASRPGDESREFEMTPSAVYAV